MSNQTTHTDPETTIKALRKKITRLEKALAQPQDFSDAYQGAREDLAIWKKRALEAEELNRKFIADINGQTFMGEPAQQEPVAWLQIGLAPFHQGDVIARTTKPTEWNRKWWRFEPLYTSPPARKPLTDEEIESMWIGSVGFLNPMLNQHTRLAFARAIEAKHNIKGGA